MQLPTDIPWLSHTFPFYTAVHETAGGIRSAVLAALPDIDKARRLTDIYFKHAAWMYVSDATSTSSGARTLNANICPTLTRSSGPVGIRRSQKPNLTKPSLLAFTTVWTQSARRWTRTSSLCSASCSL